MGLDLTAAKPKVLIFRNELLPSSETFIRAQALALRRYEAHFAGVHRAMQSMSLSPPSIFVDERSSFTGKLQRRLFWRASFAPGFYGAAKEASPRLVHAHFALDGAAALPLAERLHVPLVVTLHGYDVTSSPQALSSSEEGRLYLRRREQLWQRASVFLCVSDFIREKALAAGFPERKLKVHYTGIDLSLFEPLSVARDCDMVLFVGRLVEKKGLSHLIDALAVVRKERPEVRLVCIGDGPLRPMLEAQAAARGVLCEFLGSRPPEDVKQHLAKARVFCVPSVTAASGDSEGLGMVFAEAQAMGTPVVSFHHGGIPEVVRHSQTGLLAPEGDDGSLAQHLCHLFADDEMWWRMSLQGMEWVRERFCLQTQTVLLEEIYDQLAIA